MRRLDAAAKWSWLVLTGIVCGYMATAAADIVVAGGPFTLATAFAVAAPPGLLVGFAMREW